MVPRRSMHVYHPTCLVITFDMQLSMYMILCNDPTYGTLDLARILSVVAQRSQSILARLRLLIGSGELKVSMSAAVPVPLRGGCRVVRMKLARDA